MDKITATVIGVGLPALIFVVIAAASGTMYSVGPPPAVQASAEDEASTEMAEAEDTAPAETEEMAAAEAQSETDEMASSDAAGSEDAAADGEQMAMAETEDAAPADDTADAPETAADDSAPEEAAAEEAATEEAATETAATDEAATEEEATETAAAEEAATEEAAPAEASVDLAALVEAGDAGAGERIWRQCSACHVADREQNRVGPHLVGVLGRERASVEGFRYSDALSGLDGVWTAEEMSAWLTSPRDYAPGTSMSYRGLDDAGDRANVIAYLADLQLNGGN